MNKELPKTVQEYIEHLQSRIEALEQDAARYRWLRKGSEVQGDTYYSHSGADLDFAIDTAMKSEKGGV